MNICVLHRRILRAALDLLAPLAEEPAMSDRAPTPPLELPEVIPPTLGQRASFPELQAAAYLAHAAISPASSATAAAVQECARRVARQGAGSFVVYQAQRERLRGTLGRLFEVHAQQVALVPGTTRGLTDIALGLDLKPNESVLTYRGEFPGNVTPWQLAASRAGAHVELLPEPDLDSEDPDDGILAAAAARLHPGVRVLAVSAVQFQSGYRMPTAALSRLCREHGTRLVVDGIQAAGVVPSRPAVDGADAFVGGSHKWMLGLEGVGFSYVSEDLMQELSPITVGWMSHEQGETFLFQGPGHLRYDRRLKSSPSVFEGSTPNAMGFAALEAGADVIERLGVQGIYDHVQNYHDAIEPGLVELGFRSLRATKTSARSGILSFVPPERVEAPQLAKALRERGIFISIPDGKVRLAPHFSNPLGEVPLVLDGFRAALV